VSNLRQATMHAGVSTRRTIGNRLDRPVSKSAWHDAPSNPAKPGARTTVHRAEHDGGVIMNRIQLVAPRSAAARGSHNHRRARRRAGYRATGPRRPDPIRFSSYDNSCPLTRVGTQLVRCDDLTGRGVEAALWVPEIFPQSPQGDG
jgi:hypothetical protein